MTTIWKPIPVPAIADLYEVSNTGLIRATFEFHGLPVPRIIKPFVSRTGRASIPFRVRTREYVKHQQVHRLVAGAFIPNPSNFPFVNHIDNNPLNNNASNLEWCTRIQNARHAVAIGAYTRGVDVNTAVLTEQDVLWIRANYQRKYGEAADLCKRFGLSRGGFFSVVSGANWKHLPMNPGAEHKDESYKPQEKNRAANLHKHE